MVGSVQYAALSTRPDICEAVGICARNVEKPTVGDLQAVKRIIRYLAGTKERGLNYSSSASQEILIYVDANYAETVADFKSTSGWVTLIGGAAVNWMSKLQSVVALSTTEAEFTATTVAVQEAMYQRDFANSMKIKLPDKPTCVYNDNSGSLALTKNPVLHSRTKHFGVKQFFLRDIVNKKIVTVNYCRTDDMVADVLTKALTKDKHFKLCNIMQGIPN